MSDVEELQPLVLDLLEWTGAKPRTYEQLIDAWKTSCPRLPVWETAQEHGYVLRVSESGHAARVELTLAGRDFLVTNGRAVA